MNTLLNFEWRKSAPFRKTTMVLFGLAFLISIITSPIKNYEDLRLVLILGLIFASVGLAFIGALLYLKDDFDEKAPMNMIVPVSSLQVVLSKILIFLLNLLTVLCFGLVLLYSNIYFIRGLEGYYDFNDFNYLIKAFNINLKDIYLFVISLIVKLGELFLYSSLALSSILLVRSMQKKTGNIKWILLTIFFIFIIFLINEYFNKLAPLSLDLKSFKIIDLRDIADSLDLSVINRFVIFPSISEQILFYAFDPFISHANQSPVIMIIPLLLTIIFSVLSVRISVFLIDKKIDF